MLIQLLSQSNYGSFNITVAHMLNLETAVYLSELMNINEKALRKNKLDDNQFILDRKYITERTTISVPIPVLSGETPEVSAMAISELATNGKKQIDDIKYDIQSSKQVVFAIIAIVEEYING